MPSISPAAPPNALASLAGHVRAKQTSRARRQSPEWVSPEQQLWFALAKGLGTRYQKAPVARSVHSRLGILIGNVRCGFIDRTGAQQPPRRTRTSPGRSNMAAGRTNKDSLLVDIDGLIRVHTHVLCSRSFRSRVESIRVSGSIVVMVLSGVQINGSYNIPIYPLRRRSTMS